MMWKSFGDAAQIMDEAGTIYVRTDSRDLTKTTTMQTLKKVFPDWREDIIDAPVQGNSSKKRG